MLNTSDDTVHEDDDRSKHDVMDVSDEEYVNVAHTFVLLYVIEMF